MIHFDRHTSVTVTDTFWYPYSREDSTDPIISCIWIVEEALGVTDGVVDFTSSIVLLPERLLTTATWFAIPCTWLLVCCSLTAICS